MKYYRKNHRVQPLNWNGEGKVTFKKNEVVEKLFEIAGDSLDFTKFTDDDCDQLFQLIGMVVEDMSYRSKKTRRKAMRMLKKYKKEHPVDKVRQSMDQMRGDIHKAEVGDD